MPTCLIMRAGPPIFLRGNAGRVFHLYMAEIIKGLLGTDADLNFRVKLDENELELRQWKNESAALIIIALIKKIYYNYSGG